MRCRVTLCTALALLADFSYAANACKKDACYNAIAVQGRSNPNLARRKADCSSILRTVVNTDITKTVTAYSTAPTVTTTTTVRTTVEVTSTTTTTTSTSFEPSDFKKRAVETAIAELDARDKIVIQGQKPAYASACASNSDYAVACLCYGIQAPVQSTLTRTVTATVTTQATATSVRVKPYYKRQFTNKVRRQYQPQPPPHSPRHRCRLRPGLVLATQQPSNSKQRTLKTRASTANMHNYNRRLDPDIASPSMRIPQVHRSSAFSLIAHYLLLIAASWA